MTSYGPMRVPGAITEERSISFMTTEQEHRRRRSGDDGGAWVWVGRARLKRMTSVSGSAASSNALDYRDRAAPSDLRLR